MKAKFALSGLILICLASLIQAENDDDFVSRAYDYIMQREQYINRIEQKNMDLHCEIHEYNSMVNRLTYKIDSLQQAIAAQQSQHIQTIGAIRSSVYILLGLIVLLIGVIIFYTWKKE